MLKLSLLCWYKGSPDKKEVIPANSEGVYEISGISDCSIVLQNWIGISIINADRETICNALGNKEYYGLYSLSPKSGQLVIVENEHNILVHDLPTEFIQRITVDFDIHKVVSSYNEKYLIVVGLYGNTKVFSVFFRADKSDKLFCDKPFVDKAFIEKQAHLLSFDVHKNKYYYGLANGKIFVGYFYKDDNETYIGTYFDNHPPFVESLAVRNNGCCIVAYEDGCLREWDCFSGGLLYKYDDEKGHIASVSAVAIANDKDIIASGDAEGRILLWDSDTKSLLRQIGDCSFFQTDALNFSGLSNGISSIAFTQDDKYLIASTVSGFLSIWSILPSVEEENLMSVENKHNTTA